jgi:hypothetical protein
MKKRRESLQKHILIGMLISIGFLHSQAPNWSVNSASYSLDASIVAVLKIDDIISTDTNDIVAVFDKNDVVRGVANVSFVAGLNKYLVFITTLSNTNGDDLKFKVYDASENQILESTNTTINFSPNEVLGDAETPFELKANKVLSVGNFDKINISFYPNPLQNKFFINAKETIKSVKIYNILGKEIINLKTDDIKIELQTSSLRKGIYLIKVKTTSNNNITKKIIKR